VTRFQSTIRHGGRVRWTHPDLCPATELADLGYTLQFSIQFNFNTAGLALEKGLQKFKAKGLEALADLQTEEDAAAGGVSQHQDAPEVCRDESVADFGIGLSQRT